MSDFTCTPNDRESSFERFLNDLENRTGVSRRFLEAARPILSRLFTEVPEEKRDEVASQVRDMMSNRAVVEERLERVMTSLEEDSDSDAPCSQDMAMSSGEAANAYLRTYGGFGPQTTVLA